jgi:hypothetical protein
VAEAEALGSGRGSHSNRLGGPCRVVLCVTPSPLNCSCVIFKTRASKSALDKFWQMVLSRCLRSLRTLSSLLSWLLRLRANALKVFSPSATLKGLSGNDISPHTAAEASSERRGKKEESLLRLGCFA